MPNTDFKSVARKHGYVVDPDNQNEMFHHTGMFLHIGQGSVQHNTSDGVALSALITSPEVLEAHLATLHYTSPSIESSFPKAGSYETEDAEGYPAYKHRTGEDPRAVETHKVAMDHGYAHEGGPMWGHHSGVGLEIHTNGSWEHFHGGARDFDETHTIGKGKTAAHLHLHLKGFHTAVRHMMPVSSTAPEKRSMSGSLPEEPCGAGAEADASMVEVLSSLSDVIDSMEADTKDLISAVNDVEDTEVSAKAPVKAKVKTKKLPPDHFAAALTDHGYEHQNTDKSGICHWKHPTTGDMITHRPPTSAKESGWAHHETPQGISRVLMLTPETLNKHLFGEEQSSLDELSALVGDVPDEDIMSVAEQALSAIDEVEHSSEAEDLPEGETSTYDGADFEDVQEEPEEEEDIKG